MITYTNTIPVEIRNPTIVTEIVSKSTSSGTTGATGGSSIYVDSNLFLKKDSSLANYIFDLPMVDGSGTALFRYDSSTDFIVFNKTVASNREVVAWYNGEGVIDNSTFNPVYTFANPLIKDISNNVTLNYDPSTLKIDPIKGLQVLGAVGAQGAQGSQGYQGAQGVRGYQGSQGRQGPQGTTGAQGSQGAQGYQGHQGYQGSTGAQGSQGSQGRQGPQGTTGAQGSQGAQGYQTSGTANTILKTISTGVIGDSTLVDNGTVISTTSKLATGTKSYGALTVSNGFLSVCTSDFVLGSVGTNLFFGLGGTTGNQTGKLSVGINGDFAVGSLSIQDSGGATSIGGSVFLAKDDFDLLKSSNSGKLTLNSGINNTTVDGALINLYANGYYADTSLGDIILKTGRGNGTTQWGDFILYTVNASNVDTQRLKITGGTNTSTATLTNTFLDVQGSASARTIEIRDGSNVLKWSVTLYYDELYFNNASGTQKFKIDQSGNAVFKGDVTAFG